MATITHHRFPAIRVENCFMDNKFTAMIIDRLNRLKVKYYEYAKLKNLWIHGNVLGETVLVIGAGPS